MKQGNALFHLVRASFLERVRRRNFLVVLLAVSLLSLAIATGRLVLRLDTFVGEYNSTWVGTLVAGSTTVLLSFANFFIIKSAIGLDRRTGFGELVASTPMRKFTYLLGKVLSNFGVLLAIEGVLFASAILVQLVHAETNIDWLALLLPFLLIPLPAMAAISALALFFETLPGLRSGFGNLVFVSLWCYMMFRIMAYDDVWFDLPGILFVERVFEDAAQKMDLSFSGGYSVEWGTTADHFYQFVRWENVSWINELAGWRVYWIGIAAGLTAAAAVLFDRFDSSHFVTSLFHWPLHKVSRNRLHDRKVDERVTDVIEYPCGLSVSQITPKVQLSPARKMSGLRHFGRILWLELRLIMKRPWWWYLVSLWMIFMSLVVPVLEARTFWVPLIWLFLALTLSGIGTRNTRHHTEQLVFTAPHPLRYQLFAEWLAGIILTTVTGVGGFRLLLVGEGGAALAWGIAAVFIPSFAFASGILSGNRRLFEGVYIAWWFIGPMAIKGTALDFMGVHQDVVARGIHWYYLAAAAVLLGLAVLGRWRQLRAM